MMEHQEDIFLASLTNFKWDYAEIYPHNSGEPDFLRKINFYKGGGKLVLEHGVKIADDGQIIIQLWFVYKPEDNVAPYDKFYRCGFNGKVRYVQLSRDDCYGFCYVPVNCGLVLPGKLPPAETGR